MKLQGCSEAPHLTKNVLISDRLAERLCDSPIAAEMAGSKRLQLESFLETADLKKIHDLAKNTEEWLAVMSVDALKRATRQLCDVGEEILYSSSDSSVMIDFLCVFHSLCEVDETLGCTDSLIGSVLRKLCFLVLEGEWDLALRLLSVKHVLLYLAKQNTQRYWFFTGLLDEIITATDYEKELVSRCRLIREEWLVFWECYRFSSVSPLSSINVASLNGYFLGRVRSSAKDRFYFATELAKIVARQLEPPTPSSSIERTILWFLLISLPIGPSQPSESHTGALPKISFDWYLERILLKGIPWILSESTFTEDLIEYYKCSLLVNQISMHSLTRWLEENQQFMQLPAYRFRLLSISDCSKDLMLECLRSSVSDSSANFQLAAQMGSFKMILLASLDFYLDLLWTVPIPVAITVHPNIFDCLIRKATNVNKLLRCLVRLAKCGAISVSNSQYRDLFLLLARQLSCVSSLYLEEFYLWMPDRFLHMLYQVFLESEISLCTLTSVLHLTRKSHHLHRHQTMVGLWISLIVNNSCDWAVSSRLFSDCCDILICCFEPNQSDSFQIWLRSWIEREAYRIAMENRDLTPVLFLITAILQSKNGFYYLAVGWSAGKSVVETLPNQLLAGKLLPYLLNRSLRPESLDSKVSAAVVKLFSSVYDCLCRDEFWKRMFLSHEHLLPLGDPVLWEQPFFGDFFTVLYAGICFPVEGCTHTQPHSHNDALIELLELGNRIVGNDRYVAVLLRDAKNFSNFLSTLEHGFSCHSSPPSSAFDTLRKLTRLLQVDSNRFFRKYDASDLCLWWNTRAKPLILRLAPSTVPPDTVLFMDRLFSLINQSKRPPSSDRVDSALLTVVWPGRKR